MVAVARAGRTDDRAGQPDRREPHRADVTDDAAVEALARALSRVDVGQQRRWRRALQFVAADLGALAMDVGHRRHAAWAPARCCPLIDSGDGLIVTVTSTPRSRWPTAARRLHCCQARAGRANCCGAGSGSLRRLRSRIEFRWSASTATSNARRGLCRHDIAVAADVAEVIGFVATPHVT